MASSRCRIASTLSFNTGQADRSGGRGRGRRRRGPGVDGRRSNPRGAAAGPNQRARPRGRRGGPGGARTVFPVSFSDAPGAAAYTKRRPPAEPTAEERNTPRRRRRDPSRNAGWRRCGPWTTTPRRRPRGPSLSLETPRRSRAPRRRPPGPRARRRRGTGQPVQVPATTSAPSSARAPARKL